MPRSQTLPSYRPDIDGLRAIAVLVVVLFHAGVPGFSGGYIGVDIFFVISGYLITDKIIYGVDNSNFTFKQFYTRRIRRLFPALLSTVFFSLLAGFIFLSPTALINLSTTALSATLSVANIHFWLESGYWDTNSLSKPLLHTWSLSVEEQFYIVWPIVLLVIMKISRQFLLPALVILTLVSIAATASLTAEMPSAAFYLMPFRFFEFSLGALCLWVERTLFWKSTSGKWVQQGLLASGLAIIAATTYLYNDETVFPGHMAVYPCLATCFILLSSRAPFGGVIFINPVARYLGLTSYSIYLVHWPVIVFMTQQYDTLTGPLIAVALALTMGLASLQYHLVEQPLRAPIGKKASPFSSSGAFTRSALGLSLGVICVMGVSFYTVSHDGFPSRYDGQFAEVATMNREDVMAERFGVARRVCSVRYSSEICGEISDTNVNVLVIGDSHGIDGLNIWESAFPGTNLLEAAKSGCPIALSLEGVGYNWEGCAEENAARLSQLEDLIESIDIVVISHLIGESRVQSTIDVVNWLADKPVMIVLLGTGPTYSRDLSEIMLAAGSAINNPDPYADASLMHLFDYDEPMRQAVAAAGGYFIDKRSFFCGDAFCGPLTPGGELMMFDQNHLTLAAALEFGMHIRRNYPELEQEIERVRASKMSVNQ